VLNVACHAAAREVPVGVFSLEMSNDELVQRLLCSEARVDAQKLRWGKLSSEEMKRLGKTAGRLNTSPIWIDDTPGNTVHEVRAKARRLKAESDMGLLIIDYLQLMTGEGSRMRENRQQEVSEISRNLKALAKELNVPVVALSQLSRAVETRGGDGRPQLSDLRESGAIEQDADVVLFIYRPARYGEVEERAQNMAEIIIGKQRNGPVGSIDLVFVDRYARFENLDLYHEDPGQDILR